MFCCNCGKEILITQKFCTNCGAEQKNNEKFRGCMLKKTNNKFCKNFITFISNASLFLSGLIVSLLSLPIYIWFELKIRLPGDIRGVLLDYHNYEEIIIWDKAISALEILGVFCWVGIILLFSGIFIYIITVKGIIKKSKLRNICLFFIPIIIIIIIMISTYPALFNYESTFGYLIY